MFAYLNLKEDDLKPFARVITSDHSSFYTVQQLFYKTHVLKGLQLYVYLQYTSTYCFRCNFLEAIQKEISEPLSQKKINKKNKIK